MSLITLKSNLADYRRVQDEKDSVDKKVVTNNFIEDGEVLSEFSKVNKNIDTTSNKDKSPLEVEESKTVGNTVDPKITIPEAAVTGNTVDPKITIPKVVSTDVLKKDSDLDSDKNKYYDQQTKLLKDNSSLNLDDTPKSYDQQTKLLKDNSNLNLDNTPDSYDQQTKLVEDHSNLNLDNTPDKYDQETKLITDHSDLNIDTTPDSYNQETKLVEDHSELNRDDTPESYDKKSMLVEGPKDAPLGIPTQSELDRDGTPESYNQNTKLILEGNEPAGTLDNEVNQGDTKYVFSNTKYFDESGVTNFANSNVLNIAVTNKDLIYNPENSIVRPYQSLDQIENAPAVVRGFQKLGETENTRYLKSSGIDVPRGGAMSEQRAEEDVHRIDAFLSTQKGEDWIELQRGLHRMSPNVESRLNPLTAGGILPISQDTAIGRFVGSVGDILSTVRTVTDTLAITPNSNPNKLFNKGSFLANLSQGYRGFHTVRHGLESIPILGKYEAIVKENNDGGQNRLVRVFSEAFPLRAGVESPFGAFGETAVGNFIISGKLNDIGQAVNQGLSALSGVVNLFGGQDTGLGNFLNNASQLTNSLVSSSPLGPFRTLTQTMGPGSHLGIGRTIVSRFSDSFSDAVNYLYDIQAPPDITNPYAFLGRLFDSSKPYGRNDISLSDQKNRTIGEHQDEQRHIDTFTETNFTLNTFQAQRDGKKFLPTDFREVDKSAFTKEGTPDYFSDTKASRDLNGDYSQNNLENKFGFEKGHDTINKMIYKAYTIQEMRTPEGQRDFIKFFFMGAENKTAGNISGNEKEYAAIFRANIISMNDFFQPAYDPIQYIGRADPAFVYRSFNRNFDVTFRVAATNKEELKAQWQKLNYLASYTAPRYKNEKMAAPMMRVTIGDYFQETPVLISSLVFNTDNDVPWEINIEEDDNNKQMPFYTTVSVNFIVLHDYRPQLHGRFFSISNRGSQTTTGDNWIIGNSITKSKGVDGVKVEDQSNFNTKVADFEKQVKNTGRVADQTLSEFNLGS